METPRNSDNYDISIHAPREGCDGRVSGWIRCGRFQSTHPVRGATVILTGHKLRRGNFNPRTP